VIQEGEAQQQRIETLQHQSAMKNIEDELKRAREKESELNKKLEEANEKIASREKLQTATKQRELEGLKSQSVEIKQLHRELKSETLESTKSASPKLSGIVVQ
jgi:hypothetical protein